MGKSGPEYRAGEKGKHLQKRGKVRGFQDGDGEDKQITNYQGKHKDKRRDAA